MISGGSNTIKRSWERTYNIDLDVATKNNLWFCMQQERLYHNTLITELNAKLRVLSQEILNIKDHYEKLWGAVAQTGTKLRTISNKPVDTWPEALRPFKDIIAKDGKMVMNERMLVVYDIAASESKLHPQMRRAIATEILKWIQPQAKAMLNLTTSASGQLGAPLHMLQPLDQNSKRHVQLLGDMATISYDAESNSSTIRIPYSNTDITIRNQDLTKTPYDNIVIRQTPGRELNSTTPWQMTIKEGHGRYMLDLIDVSYSNDRKRRK